MPSLCNTNPTTPPASVVTPAADPTAPKAWSTVTPVMPVTSSATTVTTTTVFPIPIAGENTPNTLSTSTLTTIAPITSAAH
nr:unnamed protein product [Spirometra erinaceieuropaei]